MAYWLGEFRHAFFEQWERVGLAPPRPDPDAFRPPAAITVDASPSTRLGVGAEDVAPALSDQVVESVFGFGRDFGRACAVAAGIEPDGVPELSDWCGRFNLGISLFDYVCDELDELTPMLLSAPAFAQFSGRAPAAPGELTDPVVAAVDAVAREVLADLRGLAGPRSASTRRYGVWRALDRMFAAQVELSADPAFRAQGDELLAKMRTKSAEPFRVMAAYVAKGADLDRARQQRLAAFGAAAGDCFWLVDDAADVWTDLDGGRVNYFLALASEVDPALDMSSASPLVEARLGRIWRIGRVAENSSERVCGELAAALDRLDGSATEASALIATMLAQWTS